MDLSGARVLVVGATGTLGGHISDELASRGAHLALSGRDADRLAARADALGAVAIPADLRTTSSPAQVVRDARARLGGLDGLVQSAGVVAFGPVEAVEDTTLDELVVTNLLAPIRLARAAIGTFGSSGGVIVNVSAIVAEMPTAGMAGYSASKAALTAFDRALAREVRRRGVRVLDARPPHLDTGLETRPIAGEAPALKAGRSPRDAARRIVDAMEDDSRRGIDFDGGAAR